MKSIRCGAGLGDSLYLQGVVRHLVGKGQRLKVCSDYPDVFRPLNGSVEVVPFTRQGAHIIAHYTTRKHLRGTDQFQDCCLSAGIREAVDLRLDWKTSDSALVRSLRAVSGPIVCVSLPRNPMGRTDGFGAELLPDCQKLQVAINAMKGRAYVVQVGAGKPLFNFSGIDLDLANKTNVADLLDVASVASGFIGYCSFMIPLAESFGKPAMFVWSRRGLRAKHPFVRRCTPEKILHRKSSRFVFDDATDEQIVEAMNGFP